MKKTYKATQQDINMPVDIKWQKRFIKYVCWGLPQFIFWTTLFINFLFWTIR